MHSTKSPRFLTVNKAAEPLRRRLDTRLQAPRRPLDSLVGYPWVTGGRSYDTL